MLRVRRNEMQPLLDAWRLDAIARQIDMDLVPRSEALTGATVDYVEHLTKNRRTVATSSAFCRAAIPARAREAIVIGAHYDHVGLGGRLSVTPERTGEIHNGADDNASGTASIIEMARAAMDERSRFPRTLVFVAFAGEERGLLGSAYYASHAAVPDREHDRDAQPRHGRARARRRRRQRARCVAVDGSRPEGGRDGRRRRPADQA